MQTHPQRSCHPSCRTRGRSHPLPHYQRRQRPIHHTADETPPLCADAAHESTCTCCCRSRHFQECFAKHSNSGEGSSQVCRASDKSTTTMRSQMVCVSGSRPTAPAESSAAAAKVGVGTYAAGEASPPSLLVGIHLAACVELCHLGLRQVLLAKLRVLSLPRVLGSTIQPQLQCGRAQHAREAVATQHQRKTAQRRTRRFLTGSPVKLRQSPTRFSRPFCHSCSCL